jgi:hypothetical protein
MSRRRSGRGRSEPFVALSEANSKALTILAASLLGLIARCAIHSTTWLLSRTPQRTTHDEAATHVVTRSSWAERQAANASSSEPPAATRRRLVVASQKPHTRRLAGAWWCVAVVSAFLLLAGRRKVKKAGGSRRSENRSEEECSCYFVCVSRRRICCSRQLEASASHPARCQCSLH